MTNSTPKYRYRKGEVAPDVARVYETVLDERGNEVKQARFVVTLRKNQKFLCERKFLTAEDAMVEAQELRHKEKLASVTNERSLNLSITPTPSIKKEWQATFYKDLPDPLASYSALKNQENADVAKMMAETIDHEELNEIALWKTRAPAILARDIYFIINTTTPFTQWQRQRDLEDRICVADAAFELARHGYGYVFDPRSPRKNPHYPLLAERLEAALPNWKFVSTELGEQPARNNRHALQLHLARTDYLRAVERAERQKQDHQEAVAQALAMGLNPPPEPQITLPPAPELVWRANVTCKACGAPGAIFTMRNKTCEACYRRQKSGETKELFEGFELLKDGSRRAIWVVPNGFVISDMRPVDATHVGVPTATNTKYKWLALEPLDVFTAEDYVSCPAPDISEKLEAGANAPQQEAEAEPEEEDVQQDEPEATGGTLNRLSRAATRLADDMPL